MGFFLAVYLVADGWSSGVGLKFDLITAVISRHIFAPPPNPHLPRCTGGRKMGPINPATTLFSQETAQRANLALQQLQGVYL